MFTADVFILQVFIVIYVKNLHFDNNNNTPWWNIGPVYVCLYVYIFFLQKNNSKSTQWLIGRASSMRLIGWGVQLCKKKQFF